MKDVDKIKPLLRSFKLGYVEFDYAVDFLLNIFQKSNRVHHKSFVLGVSFGILIFIIINGIPTFLK